MATGWIPYDKSLPKKIQVIQLAEQNEMPIREVVGLLMELWAWFDDHTIDGKIDLPEGEADVTLLSRFCHAPVTFWKSLEKVGWLKVTLTSIVIPDFNKWFGRTAKARLQNNRRKQDNRNNHSEVSRSGHENVTLEEGQNRDSTNTNTNRVLEDSLQSSSNTDLSSLAKSVAKNLRQEWNKVTGFVPVRKISEKRIAHLKARLKDSEWQENWKEAVERASRSSFCLGENNTGWRANLDWFLKPDTLTKILEGQYDDRQNSGSGRGASSVESPKGKYDGVGETIETESPPDD